MLWQRTFPPLNTFHLQIWKKKFRQHDGVIVKLLDGMFIVKSLSKVRHPTETAAALS